MIKKGQGTDRRTIVKGAAWSVPVLATALSVPTAAATTQPEPPCPGCLNPGFGVSVLAGLAASSRATLALANPVILDATDCGTLIGNIFDFQPAFTYIVTKATLTMSDGVSYDSTVGLAPGAGVLGAVGAMPAVFAFNNVRIDSNNFRTGLPRISPQTLSVTIKTTFKWGLGAQIICENTLVWNMNGLLNVSLLAGGAGAVSYTGTTS
ncbi:hypothetical protein AUR04nite_35170 [Glutamicibacter uratoxydans]|uniref:Secreted protein n=1 Tax=Glutamicibacter uratoxydans TaxID=43667 RepID=A0A4Y4DWK0_GLUUR|nr:hypothetical protein [Glutamicibacter uratoxydans]GED07985.1 hypothetical protein AUR04nite_35170 [Glutamicibacter uratoxydans]